MVTIGAVWKGVKSAGEMAYLIAGLFFMLLLCFLLGFSDWPETQHNLHEL